MSSALGFPARRPRRFVILTDGHLGVLDSKTAVSALRYIPEEVAAVLDRAHAGRTAGDVVPVKSDVPIVADLAAARALGADSLLIGIAPVGGALPAEWRGWIGEALGAGMDVWSGLHRFLADDPEFRGLARASGARIVDLRRVPDELPVGAARAATLPCATVLTVGSDCNVGKMTAALELHRAALAAGIRSRFVATGQTGILISGAGVAVDRVISDFVAGAIEGEVMGAASGAELVVVEGQGSLFHPGYSAVTLGLLHGVAPSAMVLCHQPSRTEVRHASTRIPTYAEMIRAYESAAGWVRPARVIALALNTFDLDAGRARAEVERARAETALPAAEVVREGAAPLLEALQGHVGRKAAR